LAKKLGDIPHPQPTHEIKAMDLDSPDADRQPAGNVAIRVPLRDQFENLALAGSQARGAFSGGAFARRPFLRLFS
jgi:hypothetical protein